MVERPHALHGAVGEPLREGALPLVQPLGGGAEGAVGVRVLLEDAQQHLVRGAARRGDRHSRKYSSPQRASPSRWLPAGKIGSPHASQRAPYESE